MAFDPDAYLAKKQAPSNGGFDPDAYLAKKGGAAVSEEPSFLGVNRKNLRGTISAVARPVLEMGGAVAGGVAGAPLGPLGIAGGGALGLSSGVAAANLADRLLGVKKPLSGLPAAAKETVSNLREGAEGELMGQIGGKVISALKKPAARFAGNVGRAMSGVKAQSGERLFNDPAAFFSPSVSKVGQELGAVRNELGMNTARPAEEVFQSEASVSRKKAIDMFQKMGEGKATSAELLQGIQATDKVIEATPMRQKVQRKDLFEIKNKFSEALRNVAGPERAAARKYSRAALASEFRKVLPVTKQGDVSVMRTFGLGAFGGGGAALGAGSPKVIAALIAQNPFLNGLGITTAGAFYKAMENPILRRAITAGLKSKAGQSQ